MKKKLKEEFNRQIRIISTQAVMRSHIIAGKLNLNPTDLEALEILLREGKLTAGRLAGESGLTTGAVTGLIDRLEKSGFVSREFDPSDRRKVYVVLNYNKVKTEVIPLFTSISSSVDKLLDSYSIKDLNIILDFLKKTTDLSREDLSSTGKN